MIVERKVWENEGLLASTSKCLPVGGKGGLRRATSVRSGHALGWTSGGSGGEGTASIGSWYRGGCTALSTGMLGPRIQLAITSQQPQKNSERPWRRPRCRLRKSTGFTNAWMYAICRVTCNLLKFFRDLSNLFSRNYIYLVWKQKRKKEKKKCGKRFRTEKEGIRIARQKVKRIQFRREFGAGAVRSRSFCVFDRLRRSGAYLAKRMKRKNLLIKVIKVCDII